MALTVTIPTAGGLPIIGAVVAVGLDGVPISPTTTGGLVLKGNIDASSNPNYPVGTKGDTYYVTVAGKVGGASGKVVSIGDAVIAKADNAGGTEAQVGTSWFVLEANIPNITAAGLAMIQAADAAAQRALLSLGSAALLTAGTAATNVVQLGGDAKLPAVDGSQLTNLPGSTVTPFNLGGALTGDVTPAVGNGTVQYGVMSGNIVIKPPSGSPVEKVSTITLFIEGNGGTITLDGGIQIPTRMAPTFPFDTVNDKNEMIVLRYFGGLWCLVGELGAYGID